MAIDHMGAGAQHSAGIDRRRVLKGAAWAAPLVVVASAVPAAAASGDPTGQLVFNSSSITYSGSHWVADLGQSVKAKLFSGTAQLQPAAGQGGGTQNAKITSLTLFITVDKAANALTWGMQNSSGPSADWTLVSSTNVDNTVTLLLNYVGSALPMSTYGVVNFSNVWVNVNNATSVASMVVTGIDENGTSLTAAAGPS
jgi:hypothetical protein